MNGKQLPRVLRVHIPEDGGCYPYEKLSFRLQNRGSFIVVGVSYIRGYFLVILYTL